MWLTGRWPRIQVSLAGPYANIVLAGAVALAAAALPVPWMANTLWEVALISYLMALLCLSPFLESDGHYVLWDFLDRPRGHAKT